MADTNTGSTARHETTRNTCTIPNMQGGRSHFPIPPEVGDKICRFENVTRTHCHAYPYSTSYRASSIIYFTTTAIGLSLHCTSGSFSSSLAGSSALPTIRMLPFAFCAPGIVQLVASNDTDGVDAAVIHQCKAGQVPNTSHTAEWERCAPVPEHRDAGMLDSVVGRTHGPGIIDPSRRLPAVSEACASSQGSARSIGDAMYAQS
ncbi:hypothetical protein BDP55DRAFT_186309 [Colletotrichum godetiae]|uniref:Uncharacterized protein n=1 Tax=Colletotrichum godetiae TaxID=1209918 RepID=A0AAJ0AMG2_9PEZI|nr:uncharacterized protein BDP55DRAFT_186309 [Colletotrichum godetiae]KAK1674416.1 hypothetical protein BDP55DRAFT_186309 [Colletotrichum godetiae]